MVSSAVTLNIDTYQLIDIDIFEDTFYSHHIVIKFY